MWPAIGSKITSLIRTIILKKIKSNKIIGYITFIF